MVFKNVLSNNEYLSLNSGSQTKVRSGNIFLQRSFPGMIAVAMLFILIFLLFWACQPTNPQEIIHTAITAHGGEAYEQARIEFDFRDRHYTAHLRNGLFTYTRAFRDSSGFVEDILSNSGFLRQINGQRISVTPEMSSRYKESVNSVWYFALLPYPLRDPAVVPLYLGRTTIRGEPYDKIEVTFREEGGGEDYRDVFVYWIHQQHHTIDYLAYQFHVNGGGMRFRRAVNPRTVGGIRFADYENYRPDDNGVQLADLDRRFEAGQLILLSQIKLENIRVEILSPQ